MDHKKVRSYVEALEDERRKIQVFQRELPLCMELVSQAIDTCKQQLSEAPSMGGCVLEEFMPTLRSSSAYEDDHNASSSQNDKDETMSDWLRSASLWNPSADDTSMKTSHQISPPEVKQSDDEGAACSSALERDETAVRIELSPDTVASALPPPLSAATTDSEKSGEKQEQTKLKKQRRNWSPELHRRFVHALQQLGGSHAATPKQIKEVMKVDGLTNDEIKSHLQKYRVYAIKRKISTTRPPSRGNYICTQHPQTQFVVVGGMWVPPPSVTATPSSVMSVTSSLTAAEPTIYTPVAVHNYRLPEEAAVSNTRDGVSKSATASSSNSTQTITVCCS